MALGGLGAVLLSGHPSLSPGHVISQVDLRSVFFAVVFVIIVLVLAYLTNPSETSFRTYLTEQSFKQHLRRLDDGSQEEGAASDDSGLHYTLSRRNPPATRKAGSNFDPTSPFHFVSRASVSLRTPKHVFYSFGLLTIAAVYPTGRPHTRGSGHAIQPDNLASSVSDAWFVGAFGRWWRGGIIQSWWHDMIATTKDAERGGSGILDVKALDVLEGYNALPFHTPSRQTSDTAGKLRGTERSTAKSTTSAPRSSTPPPLPKSASLPLHVPRAVASTTQGNPTQIQRHASSPAQTSASSAISETTRPSAPPMLSYSPSSTSLFDSSPVIAEVLRQISQSKAAVVELRTQLEHFRSKEAEARANVEHKLEEQRSRKREEDAARGELKTRTKTLEDAKRTAEGTKRDVEKRLRAAKIARDSATARIEKLDAEIGALQTRMSEDEAEIVRCKDEGGAREQNDQQELERKKKEIKVAEDVVAALNSRAKELETRIAQEEARLRKAKEDAEIKKQDRSFYPLHVVPAVHQEEITIPSWTTAASYAHSGSQAESLSREALAHPIDYAEHPETFLQPIQPPRSKGSASSGSGNSDHREPSVSPRPARLSLTSISNLREPAGRLIPEPDPNGQVLVRPHGFSLFSGDLPSTVSTRSTSTRFSPFGDSDEPEAPVPADAPSSAHSSISPTSTSLIPASLIHSLDGSVDTLGLSRSFQSDDDTVLDRDWRKNARFPPPPPVESPNASRVGAYTMSPVSLTCPSFDGVDKEDPFEVRPRPVRRRITAEPMDLQRATLPPSRTISDPPLPPVALTSVGQQLDFSPEPQDKTGSAHRRWYSQQDAAKERKGLNPEAKAFSLTKKSFPSLFSTSNGQVQSQSETHAPFDGLPSSYTSASLSSLSSSHLSTSSSLSLPPALAYHGADADNVFSTLSMRAFAPSAAEREVLQRSFGGSANASLERLPTLSEVSSIPSMASKPPSPSHTQAVPAGLNAPFGLAMAVGTGKASAAGFGSGRMALPQGLAWLQSLPRVRKPKFSPWEDEENPETGAGVSR
ncbi:hypothetical protein C8Q78DRAFT_1010802 [Trametes maxima]|nr:hypothetical protein C8Q78DRAFT_1010802 [Trametes maxima]